MDYLLDANILLRLTNVADPQFAEADRAVNALHARGHRLCVTPQCLIEFRNVATRPADVNGLGLSVPAAEVLMTGYEALFAMLDETPDIYPAWKALVSAAGVIGKQVHDARLAAVCSVHGVAAILTFNVRDFSRFEPHLPGFAAAAPANV